MTEKIEKNILSCFLMSDMSKQYLTRVKPEWFTGWHSEIVKIMHDMYIQNVPIGLHTVYQYFPKRAHDLALITNHYVTDVHIERELLIMEVEYNKRHLLGQLSQVESAWNLEEIQNFVEKALHEARVLQKNHIKSMGEVVSKKVDEIEERIKSNDHMKGLHTGWLTLDKYIGGWNKGNLVVVGGRPGMGKSALGLNFCIDGSPFAKFVFVSIEMSEDELAERMIADLIDIENYKVRNAKLSMGELENVVNKMMTQSDYHVVDTKDNNVYNIISLLKIHRAKYGLDVVVIDYLQKLEAGGRDLRTNVGMASTALKNFARELGITVIALAQLNRDGKNARPELTELKESGQIEQDADVVLFPFRPAYYEDVKPDIEDSLVIIAKNRHGKCVDIPCTFSGPQTRYRENVGQPRTIKNPFE
jgi:replicative DNA helicase